MEIVERALNNFKQDKAHWGRIYQKAKEDLNFLSDEQFAQWDWTDASRRYDSGRPVLTIDQLSQFVHQVVNDIRMNTPSIGVIPAGDEASVETAEIYKGLIRNIEYISQAELRPVYVGQPRNCGGGQKAGSQTGRSQYETLQPRIV